MAVVDTWAALTRPRPHRPALSDADALAVLRREVRAGRLPGKLVDALERVVGAGGRTDPPAVTEDEPDEADPPETVVTQPATGRLALSL